MKDKIKRALIIACFGLFTGFMMYNLIQWNPIVKPEYSSVINYILYGVLILFPIYLVVYYWVRPMHIKFSRAILFVIGISAIILGKTLLVNDGSQGIYFGDLSSVFGVITLILGPTGLLFTKKIHKQKEEKDLEIIEV